ncbi:hypothetical protein K438DRAFT_1784417 [Mycena galopus ATCC 62051]|nr:hypothetical protein K438DRAFT_1784417 [Mycena galopus ATCC 62051]
MTLHCQTRPYHTDRRHSHWPSPSYHARHARHARHAGCRLATRRKPALDALHSQPQTTFICAPVMMANMNTASGYGLRDRPALREQRPSCEDAARCPGPDGGEQNAFFLGTGRSTVLFSTSPISRSISAQKEMFPSLFLSSSPPSSPPVSLSSVTLFFLFYDPDGSAAHMKRPRAADRSESNSNILHRSIMLVRIKLHVQLRGLDQQRGRARGGVEPLSRQSSGNLIHSISLDLIHIPFPFVTAAALAPPVLRNTVLGILSRRFLDSLKVQRAMPTLASGRLPDWILETPEVSEPTERRRELGEIKLRLAHRFQLKYRLNCTSNRELMVTYRVATWAAAFGLKFWELHQNLYLIRDRDPYSSSPTSFCNPLGKCPPGGSLWTPKLVFVRGHFSWKFFSYLVLQSSRQMPPGRKPLDAKTRRHCAAIADSDYHTRRKYCAQAAEHSEDYRARKLKEERAERRRMVAEKRRARDLESADLRTSHHQKSTPKCVPGPKKSQKFRHKLPSATSSSSQQIPGRSSSQSLCRSI